jgi:hypothetical protein
MRLFVAFLVLCFLGGMVARPGQSEGRLRLYVAALCLALVVGIFVFHQI